MSSVQIVGSEIICSAGFDQFATYRNILQQKTFVQADGLAPISPEQWESLIQKTLPPFRGSKCTILSSLAMQGALNESGWSPSDLEKAGFIFASTTSQIDQWENDLPDYRNPHIELSKIESAVFNQSLGSPLHTLADHFHVRGPKAVIASSCSAGLQAIAMAYRWIQSGKVDRCIVGSTEILSQLTTLGFNSLRLISKNPSKPFSLNRNGINLGEGTGFLFLHKNKQDQTSLGFISGASFNLDAYHPTSPDPEGQGSLHALQDATKEANLSSADIDWIYSHGTGSPANDLSEAIAIQKFFGTNPCAPITSTKSIHGHTLAASGVIESILGLIAMKEQQVLPTLNDQVSDPKIDIPYFHQAKPQKIRHFIKNSLGFGGVNAAVVFSAKDQGL